MVGYSPLYCTLWANLPGYFRKNGTGMKSFHLSFEDTQDKNDWRLRIKEATR